MRKYIGAIHIHSKFSDGTGDLDYISKCAQKAGLKWIIITDHNNFDIEEGIFNNVCVIKGEEISPKQNHYLAFGINDCINCSENPLENINSVKSSGGFGFSAHPDESENRQNNAIPIKWTDKNIIPEGVEIWNWFSQWADNYNGQNIFSIVYSYLFKNKLITKPYKSTLDWWDELNKNSEKIIPAICGVDAHALKINKYIIPITVFPYMFMFKTFVNQIILNKPLSENFAEQKLQILNAIKNGHNVVANINISKNIPNIYISNKSSSAFSGDIISLDDETYLNIENKFDLDIFIVKDGKNIFKSNSNSLKFKIEESGNYRVETEMKGKGFAYSNPIKVK